MTRIMIVDASEESRLLMKNLLLTHNHNVVAEASDGIEAIEKYHSEKPDLIFLDLEMPKLDGLSVLRKIKFQDHTSSRQRGCCLLQSTHDEIRSSYRSRDPRRAKNPRQDVL